MKHYDYLIVGAGLFGSVFARQATDAGKKCLVIDKRPHIAGNAHCETIEGIRVHSYGAHIFHTSDKEVWRYVNHYTEFNHYINSPIAIWDKELYNLPFNMNTFSKMWHLRTPEEAKRKIAEQTAPYADIIPQNLEEQALKLAGPDIYHKLIKGYTEKQWGRDCKDLPAFIIKRLPFRFTYDNNYFSDPYQGIPKDGYDAFVAKLLEGSELRLSTEYSDLIKKTPNIADKTIYTGMIDAFFNFKLGVLEYRTLRFETETLDCDNYQGNAVVNYTKREIPYTRIIEHKHFEFGTQPKTVVTKEYPSEWHNGMEPYYPVNDAKNQALYKSYVALAKNYPDIYFGGRLGSYCYYNMDQVIRAALDLANQIL